MDRAGHERYQNDGLTATPPPGGYRGFAGCAAIAARMPWSIAVGDGGHPGIVTSTGSTSDTAPIVA